MRISSESLIEKVHRGKKMISDFRSCFNRDQCQSPTNGKDFSWSTCVGRSLIVMEIQNAGWIRKIKNLNTSIDDKKRVGNFRKKQKLMSFNGLMTWNRSKRALSLLTRRCHRPSLFFLIDWFSVCITFYTSPRLISILSDILDMLILIVVRCLIIVPFAFETLSKSFNPSRAMTLIGVWKRKQWDR